MTRDELEKYIVELASRLIEVRTVNYNVEDYPDEGPDGMEFPGMEYRAADIVKAELQDAGIQYSEYGQDTGRPEVVASIGRGEEGMRVLLVAAHTDTVPSGSEPWKESPDPFRALVKDGMLFGRGALDNKGQLAALVAAGRLLKMREKEIPGKVLLAAVSDEEVGGSKGLRDIVEKGLIQPTDAIIPDVGYNMKSIVIGEKGRALVEVRCNGRAAHGSTPYVGSSAISGMARFINELDSRGIRYERDELFADGTTCNAGLLEGGDAPNMVAARATLVLDIRYVPSCSAEQIVKQLEDIGHEISSRSEHIDFEVTLKSDSAPMQVNRDAPLVMELQKLTNADLTGIGGGTVSKLLNRSGVVSVGFGPGEGRYFHMADERVEIGQLVRFAEIITDISISLTSRKRD